MSRIISYYFFKTNIIFRSKGVYPFNKKGELILRCKKKGHCKAKARVKFLREHTLLDDLETNQAIVLNADNWELIDFLSPPHTCGYSSEEPFYSERENFGRRLVYWKQTINDHGGDMAWKMTAAEFASGYGITF